MTSDWDQRMLCPDGACIGVIGPDGTCKACGRAAPNWGDERRRGRRNTDEVEQELEEKVARTDLPAAPDDFDSRLLCPDGACIGVIGPDGRCKVCGRKADAPTPGPPDGDAGEPEDDDADGAVSDRAT